jgi:hypothetical protein
MPIEKSFGLSTAQERNLREWSKSELVSMAYQIPITLPRPATLESVQAAIKSLVRMHGALRSRVAYQADGAVIQQVYTLDDALARLEYSTIKGSPHPSLLSIQFSPNDVNPEETAFCCSLLMHDNFILAIQISISPVFADGFSIKILERDFMRLLRHPQPTSDFPSQPDAHSRDSLAEAVQENTEFWKDLLIGVPRSCTYSGVKRAEYEDAYLAEILLSRNQTSTISAARVRLRVSEHSLWTAATSSLVQALTGQSEQVFRSIYANRFAMSDADAVVQVSQSIFLPVRSAEFDSLADRTKKIFEQTADTYRRGVYDMNALVDWINGPPHLRGAIFQPAFEINHVPVPFGGAPARRPRSVTPTKPLVSRQRVRIDPGMARADLKVQVFPVGHYSAGNVVRLWARRPLYTQRHVSDLLTDLLQSMRGICEAPEARVLDLPIQRLPAAATLQPGHHSGVAIDDKMLRSLMMEFPGVYECVLSMMHGKLTAKLRTRHNAQEGETILGLTSFLRARQPWFSGTVIPDEISS